MSGNTSSSSNQHGDVPRKRAHRWDPVAYMAVCRNNKQQQRQEEVDDDHGQQQQQQDYQEEEFSPVVVFCPFAAKGSQLAGGGSEGAAAASAPQQQSKAQQEQQQQQQQQQQETTTVTMETEDGAKNISNNNNNDARRAARNKDDIVTATAFWLVHSTLNRVIARLEKDGLISALTDLVQSNQGNCTDTHVASHQRYRERVLAMLPRQGQRDFFTSEFIENPKEAKRKFGNQAVSHARDLKCAHALVAQALVPGLGPCPLGDVVIGFIKWLGQRVQDEVIVPRRANNNNDNNNNNNKHGNGDNDDDAEAGSDKPAAACTTGVLFEKWHQQLLPLFKQYAKSFVFTSANAQPQQEQQQQQQQHHHQPTDATDLIAKAQIIVDAFAAEVGEGSGRRRKRRTD